jgi:predicted Ser/Thr protein kinase
MDPRAETAVLYPLVGQSLGQYRIESVLGQGGMGVVYRAQDLKLQRPVALKLLPTTVTGDPERRKRFLLEARAAARISHPAIAQVYDVDEHQGTIFIAMELVDGKTIGALLADRELDLAGAIDVALQVAGGLAKAHAAGIVHRDIKPANVIQTPDGHVKILDFGLAKLLDPESSTITSAPGGVHDLSTVTRTHAGAVKGTPAYMSPEQVKGEPVDARSDLFSLGVMLFEMVTGQAPFRRPTPLETMHALAFDETPALHTLRPNLPGALERISARCLAKRPEDRYANARALVEELQMLRRELEPGQTPGVALKRRVADALDRVTHLKPAGYAWLVGGIVAAALAVYLLFKNVGFGPIVAVVVIGLLVYRHVRHQPQRMLDQFVRKLSKLPEVRLVACEGRKITVGVDRAAGQLYGRIGNQLSVCNSKLFFGEPFTVGIRDDLSAEEVRQVLSGVGVRYVRNDVPASADRQAAP